MSSDLTGKQLGPFLIEARIGQGAMGTVYRARHLKNGKKAAIKVMVALDQAQDPTLAKRFEREIKLLSQFRHPNIVRIYGDDEDAGIRYYAMELVEGQTLADVLAQRKKLSFARAIAYTMQICEALQEMHAVGVIHRDLKPANLLITTDHRVKLTDFGIAKDVSAFSTSQLTKADHTVGTIAYMSPEQLSGAEITRKSDLYSLGILLYQMLTGRLPFSGETMFEYLHQRVAGAFPAPSAIDSAIPVEFDQLCRELLAQEPDDRPKDAYVVLQRLLEINKKAKEGTLQKTRAIDVAVADTVAVPKGKLATLVATVAELAAPTRKKKKRTRRGSDGSFWESTWFLTLCLTAVVGIAAWAFWPAGASGMKRDADRLLASEDYHDWQKALDAYLLPLQKDYPSFAAEQKIDQIVERTKEGIQKAEAKGIANKALKLNIRRSDATQAEKQYIDALIIQQNYGDRATAQQRFRAILELFKDDPVQRGWVLLAQDQLQKNLQYENDAERVAEKRQIVSKAIEKVRKLRDQDKLTEALQTFASLEELYVKDEEVADLLREASREFLGPEELFRKGERLMNSADPLDWRKAFDWYFNPLLEKYPGGPQAGKIAAYREKRDQGIAAAAAEQTLKFGPAPTAGALERDYALALFLERKLEDLASAKAVYRRIAEAPVDGKEAGFQTLAKSRLAALGDEPPTREEKLRSAKAARGKLQELANGPSDSPNVQWSRKVRDLYADDKDLAELEANPTGDAGPSR